MRSLLKEDEIEYDRGGICSYAARDLLRSPSSEGKRLHECLSSSSLSNNLSLYSKALSRTSIFGDCCWERGA